MNTEPNRSNPTHSDASESTDAVHIRGMGAAAFAVRYPVTVSMFFIGIIMLGWISLTKLPTNLFPDLRTPRVTVVASAPGLAPQEIERIVIEPLEGRLATIKGVDKVSSVSRADSGAIVIDFHWGADMDFAMLEVKKSVQGAEINEIESIETYRYDPNALPILTLALTGDRSLEEMRYLAERTIGPALERIEGVARAVVTGGLIPEVHCMLNAELLHFYGLTINQVATALDQANVSASGGWIEEGNRRYMIRAVGEIKTVEQVAQTVVGYANGVPIYITDLGTVKWDVEEPINLVRMNGKAGIGLSLYKEAGSNTVEVVRSVRKFLGKVEETPSFFASNAGGGDARVKEGGSSPMGQGGAPKAEGLEYLPKDTGIEIAYDQSLFITRSIEEVKSTAMQGIALAALILLVFLRNVRTTLIVSLSIPVSILATFNLMYFMDLSLNIMTLGGLALGAGMLVDNAIVVIENIFRRRQIGDNSYGASVRGAGEVASAIAASTLTTVVVFIPIAYMGGVTAQLFKEQALTVVFSLMTSLVVALVMIPALCSKFLRAVPAETSDKEGWYAWFLRMTLQYRSVTSIVVILICVSSVPILKGIKQEFIPQAAETQFIIKLRMPPGSRIETTETVVRNVEGWLMNDLGYGVKNVYARAGAKPDDVGGVDEEPEGTHTAEIVVTLTDLKTLNVPAVIEFLDPRCSRIEGLEVNYLMSQTSLSSMIGGEKAALVVEIRGRSLETLASLAGEVKRRMDLLPEVTNGRTTILDGNPEVHLVPDRTLMAEMGLDQQQLISLVRGQLRGTVATSMQDLDQTKAIRVQLGDGRMNLPELMNSVIPVGGDRAVTLKNLVEYKVEPGPREILHREQERIARVLADVGEGSKLSEAVASVKESIGPMQLPSGYSIRFGGEEERRKESFDRLLFALILALILVYMVMASLFESLLHPFVIMFSMPLAAVGVIWAFALTGQTLNLMGYIGIIMLAGIVVNNAIVLVDYVNFLRREEGAEMYEAIVRAGCRRLRPILMTTLTTVLALLPLALGFGEGAEIRAPMAVAVIGGLLSSTILTLVIIPVVYSIFEDAKALVVRILTFVFRLGARRAALPEVEG
ncbi:MAG: efflux RND transporter permease subunit [bacterium]|jgi:HAE1 family hydrophobic/amphiphilic exporter-1|nr:efflux RND transporter permease subunit [bacterium]